MTVASVAMSSVRPVATPVIVRDDAPRAACDAYVTGHPDASGYHYRAWLGVIERAFRHRTAYLAAESDGRVVGVLPLVFFRSRFFGRFVVSMPFLNYGGILADTPDIERVLLARAIEEARRDGASHLELRHRRQLFPELAAKRHKVAMRLALESTSERQWDSLDKKVRNQVRKAEKSGLVGEHGGMELLEAFYSVFAHNMRDLGTPVYTMQFFREVLSTFPEASRVFVVRADGRPVAASIVYGRGETLEVPWASAIRAFNPMCANVLLYWHMLRFAIEGGAREFDFGRSTPGEGTFHFKRQWGAQPHELVWEYWTAAGGAVPDLSHGNPRFSTAVAAWQRLPLAVANRLGPLIVRNIP